MSELERIPAEEARQIENVVRLTVEQLKRRYPAPAVTLRGVHPKDHGCVTAKFRVHDPLADEHRVGVFAAPGREYDALVRFSNAAVFPAADSPVKDGVAAHGSRGMAIKLTGVSGTRLVPGHGPLTQDFLMINQPVFAFSNVEDYEVVSRVLLEQKDDASLFFAQRVRTVGGRPDLADPATRRALRTLAIVQQIRSATPLEPRAPFRPQSPPASPVDNRYFSAAPFLFGDGRAMKYAANPIAPRSGEVPDVADENYLRAALKARLTGCDAQPVVFAFQVQVRPASDFAGKVEAEIEDACFEWDEAAHPFASVATLTIPPQDFDSPQRRALCESLSFTPWHGVAEHRPLGGINRMRRAVYEASTQFRHLPREPEGV